MQSTTKRHDTVVIYHGPGCADGIAAAWAIWSRLGDSGIEYIPMQYGQAPDLDLLKGRQVVLVDFSFKRDVMLQVAEVAHAVTVLDHHKSAETELVDLPASVTCVFDMRKSGCRLAWEYARPSSPMPELLRHIEDRDLWRKTTDPANALRDTDAVMAAAFSYPMDTVHAFDQLTRMPFGLLVQDGQALLRDAAVKRNAWIKAAAYTGGIFGYADIPFINVPYFMVSETCHQLAIDFDAPFAVGWYDDGVNRKFSLRAHPDKGVQVHRIAEQFGGGGHPGAAGFSIPLHELHVNPDLLVNGQ